jgi:biotin transport system substrate-specific component
MNLNRPRFAAVRPAVCASSVPSPRVLWWTRLAGVSTFALATALGAQLVVPLPHTPVPITLQSLPVLLAGVVLGPRHGALSMALYVLLGSVGYHIFAGGTFGPATVLGATGGYLLGFVLAQPVIGKLTVPVGGRVGWGRLFLALLAGKGVIFACGLAWLHAWAQGSVVQTLAWGLWPFVPGLVVKLGLAYLSACAVPPRARAWFQPPAAH